MRLALYSLAISVLYAALAIVAVAAAQALIVAFVAALLVPHCWARWSGRGRL